LTFSRSLAEHLQRWCGPEGLQLRRRTFRVGRELRPGEVSRSGAYALVDRRKGKTLRIALDREVAALLASESREIRECWLA
jgi:hypothetical protein